MNNKAKIVKFAETTVKIIIVLLGFWILYKELFISENVNEIYNDVKNSFTNKKQFALMTAAFCLVPVNIYLESIKWKLQLK